MALRNLVPCQPGPGPTPSAVSALFLPIVRLLTWRVVEQMKGSTALHTAVGFTVLWKNEYIRVHEALGREE